MQNNSQDVVVHRLVCIFDMFSDIPNQQIKQSSVESGQSIFDQTSSLSTFASLASAAQPSEEFLWLHFIAPAAVEEADRVGLALLQRATHA